MVFPVVWRIEELAEAASTQDVVKSRAACGESEGLAVHALRQNSGYGRYGRPWISLDGNLFLSVLLRPECPAHRAGEFGILAGVALADAVAAEFDRTRTGREALRLKAPNDLYLGRRKTAGILIESELSPGGASVERIVIGVGVNLRVAPGPEFSCLAEFLPDAPDVRRFRDALLAVLARRYCDWQTGGFEAIRAQWDALLFDPGAE